MTNTIVFVAKPLPNNARDSAVDPDRIARHKFDFERRGFDQQQVRAYLVAVADSLRDAQVREAEMRTRLGKAIGRAEKAEQAARETKPTDESALTKELGEQVTTVLDAARAAGEQRIAAAENSATKLLANAKTEATELRRAAETIMDERRAEADAAAAEILKEAEAAAQEITDAARAKAEKALKEAAKRVAHARAEGDALVEEAEEARLQILEDMDRRRRRARAQVERLRVGRDRLLRSYDVVRRTLDETTGELKGSLKEAKVLGDTAARVAAGEPLRSRDELEAELADARIAGLLRTPARPRPEPPAADPKPPQVPNIDLRTSSSPATPTPRSDPPRADEAPKPKRPATGTPASEATSKPVPRPPAVAPTIKASAPAREVVTVDEPAGDAEFDQSTESIDDLVIELKDDDLDVVEPADEVEEVVALATDAATGTRVDEPASDLFAALRAQSEPAAESKPKPRRRKSAAMARQRDAVVGEAAAQLEKRLKRALADEQNELLAGIRAAKKKPVALLDLVGDPDAHVGRYVIAIHEQAAITYGAGAALVDGDHAEGELPAGAVEELLVEAVVDPIRGRLTDLDATEVDIATAHVDPIRAFYRQRKTDHLADAAAALASLLCNAGAHDALPDDTPLPW